MSAATPKTITDTELDNVIDAVFYDCLQQVKEYRRQRGRIIDMLIGQAMKSDDRLSLEVATWIVKAKLDNPYFKTSETRP